MEPSPADSSASTDLCTSCGLCCSGVLFDTAPLDADEIERATELGLKPYFEPPGQARFDFPCPHLQGSRCGVYPRRPRICGAFRCELLKKFESGEVSGAEATAIISEAKVMIAELRPLAVESGGPITPKRWGLLLDAWAAKTRAGKATPKQARLVLELARLNRFLDTHFRHKDQQVVKAKP
jgi:Fe-S-cluster containining protein